MSLDVFFEYQTIPKLFTEFVEWLGIKLFPGQKALFRVIYDGVEPIDLSPEERELVRPMIGDVDHFPAGIRRIICLVIGARAGKTKFASLRALHLALTVALPDMGQGQYAWAVIIAPDPRQRDEAFNNVKGAVFANPTLTALVIPGGGPGVLQMRRPDGQLVAVESLPAKAGGLAGRGRVLCAAILEEAAFFGTAEQQHVITDEEIFSGVSPRVVLGGQIIVSSTPFAESGLLYDLFVKNHPNPNVASPHLKTPGRPQGALAAHAPTLAMRPVEEVRQIIELEKARNPLKVAREYYAQFITAGTGQWFDSTALANSVRTGEQLQGGGTAAVGLDIALKHDFTGIVGGRLRANNHITIQMIRQMRPQPGQPLMPSEVVAEAVELALQMKAESIISDGVYEGTVREQVRHHPLAHVLAAKRNTIFTAAKVALLEGRLELPDDPELLRQLRSVRGKELPGGDISIEMERSSELGHCDLVPALCNLVWRLGKLTPPAEEVEYEQHDPIEREARRLELRARQIKDRPLRPQTKVRPGHRWWERRERG